MIWLNLLKNRCPACNSPLEAHLTVGDFIVCLVNPLTSNQEDKDYWES